MDTFHQHEYFSKVVFDWRIRQPDLGYQFTTSLLACAIMCRIRHKCSTVVIVPDVKTICEMSERKGTCMEKEEASRFSGSRMYQKKVCNLWHCINLCHIIWDQCKSDYAMQFCQGNIPYLLFYRVNRNKKTDLLFLAKRNLRVHFWKNKLPWKIWRFPGCHGNSVFNKLIN
jgi:hypothetical protein